MGPESVRRQILIFVLGALALTVVPASAQIELTGSYVPLLYEDYIERGPGSDLGDFTGMPMTDEARAKALLYTSNLPSTIERQCLAQAPWVGMYRPLGMRIWSEVDRDDKVIAWKIEGDYLRDTLTIWMDGRPEPSPNALSTAAGFSTGKWEGDTLTVRTTHVKTTWIRRGNGIPASDQTTYWVHITRHDDLLTVVSIQEDPFYLSEPHVVSRVWKFDPRGNQGGRAICNTANEIPRLEDTAIVPHYLPGQNPEADFMTRTYNLPKEAALGFAESLYPEYRHKLKGLYTPPAACGRYCCGWIERQGLPGAAPGLSCNDGGLGELNPVVRSKQGEGEGKSAPVKK